MSEETVSKEARSQEKGAQEKGAQEKGTQIAIELAFALPQEQVLLTLRVPVGCTVAQAVLQSGIHQQFPDFDFNACKTGIWSRVVPDTQELKSGDRVELYRPLIADPKDTRKARAKRAKNRA